jgi:hypothetical protein
VTVCITIRSVYGKVKEKKKQKGLKEILGGGLVQANKDSQRQFQVCGTTLQEL